ncbi:hypothetical protein IEQ34_021784 [Dendrobium chrysotoxum]|uniref:DYW domain-containing protein n=1 Tax=Dendrobium chrysotoxum TaxID=161865 RepID=A0AAV7G4G4_DENCH|nr:hypothetical protein IEQ34_021784 [Dendrobium chrysotoxum]
MFKTLSPLNQMITVLSQSIVTNSQLTPISFRKLIDLSLSSSSQPNLLFLLSQYVHLLDTNLFNSLIRSYTNSHRHLESTLVFTHMPKLGIPPDLFTFPPLLKSISHLYLPSLGVSVHGSLIKLGFSSHVFSATALVTMYSSLSRISDACCLFGEMPDRNSVSWNAMITGLVHNRKFKEAHRLFSEMISLGYELGEVTVVGALTACAHLGSLNQGIWIHNYVVQNRLRMNVFVGTALVDMYMKCGEMKEAMKVFREMRVKSVFSWNALISGLAMNGRGEMAFEAFDSMIKENFKPDSVTFLALLCACCHQGFVEDGRRYFIAMERDFGLQPKIEHHGSMVDLLGRAGLLDEAHELIKTMPMKGLRADAVIWRALLTACRIHGNIQLGKHAVQMLLDLDPDNSENYVLLSNLLVRDRRWNAVGKVREMMSRRGIAKLPGCSSIEINNTVYEFVVTSQFDKDGMHDIYEMVTNMNWELKLAGYVAETDMVSYDLEEEEKESSLMYHSEKLALAFGLLKTSHGLTLRIVKNLRVCKDCHSYFKLVSKVYQREIVVRDRNRFHHFSAGACSCRDYW